MKMNIRENFDIYFELVKDVRSQAHIEEKFMEKVVKLDEKREKFSIWTFLRNLWSWCCCYNFSIKSF